MVCARMVISHYFKVQMKLEASRRETMEAQRKMHEAERKSMELSLSQTVKEFNYCKAEVISYRKELKQFRDSFNVEIQNLLHKYGQIEAQLIQIAKLFKEHKEQTEEKLKAVETKVEETFGKVIVKDSLNGSKD